MRNCVVCGEDVSDNGMFERKLQFVVDGEVTIENHYCKKHFDEVKFETKKKSSVTTKDISFGMDERIGFVLSKSDALTLRDLLIHDVSYICPEYHTTTLANEIAQYIGKQCNVTIDKEE